MQDEVIELLTELKKIKENFDNMKKNGANIWNGEVLCVTKCDIEKDKVNIICEKSDSMLIIYMEKEKDVQKNLNVKI